MSLLQFLNPVSNSVFSVSVQWVFSYKLLMHDPISSIHTVDDKSFNSKCANGLRYVSSVSYNFSITKSSELIKSFRSKLELKSHRSIDPTYFFTVFFLCLHCLFIGSCSAIKHIFRPRPVSRPLLVHTYHQ